MLLAEIHYLMCVTQTPTPLENVELVIEGNIDSADFICNAMKAIEI